VLVLVFCWAALVSGPAFAYCYLSDWFSEEGKASAFCKPGYAVRGVLCSGRHCDNKRLRCCDYAGVYDRSTRFWWSPWFSEEGEGQFLSSAGFVSGIACSGAYCDNLRLNYFSSSLVRNNGQCRFTRPFSGEGSASGNCGDNEFVAGCRCSGPYCGNLELWCCGRS
jgi:hypothetical protein